MTRPLIGVTGSPATGKKAVGAALAERLGCRHATVLELARSAGAILGYDEAEGEYIVDTDSLRRRLRSALPDGTCVLSGVLLPYVLPPRYARLVVVLRASPKVLYARYLERGYSKGKISDNLLAEALGVLLAEAIRVYGERLVHEVDAGGRSPSEVAAEVVGIIEGRARPELLMRDWLDLCVEDGALRELCLGVGAGATGEPKRDAGGVHGGCR